MTFDREFQRKISDRPSNLILCLVVSILLHLLLLTEAKNWLSAFLPQPKRETSEPIAIEFVDVPPKETPPPQTQRRAANNSVAGGQARRDRPVSAATATPVQPKAPTRQSAQSTAILPKRSVQQRQPTPQVTRPVPTARPPTPQEEPAPAPSISQPQPTPQVTRPVPITRPQPTPQVTEPTPTISRPQSQPQTPVAVAPSRTQPQTKPQATAKAPTLPQPRSSTPQQKNNHPPTRSAAKPTKRTAAKILSPARSRSGAASKLGGPMALSSRDLGSIPNSNRFNRATAGIDARRDVDMGAYYQQLQQRVRQQWIPGITQSSYQTVVYFVVSRSGQIRGLRIVRPSGSTAVDNAALGAVQRAAPFAPLPTGYSGNSVNILFTFNINLSGELELRAR